MINSIRLSVLALAVIGQLALGGDTIIGGGGGSGNATKLQGFEISPATPLANDELTWNNSIRQWVPTAESGGFDGKFADLDFADPANANITLSNSSKTLLLGATSVPADYATTIGAKGQITIVTDPTPSPLTEPFIIFGAHRNGVDGERYYTAIWNDGHISTNSYLTLQGLPANINEPGGYMQLVSLDVPTGIVLSAQSITGDPSDVVFIKGYGYPDSSSNPGVPTPVVASLGVQGTLRLNNPYGVTGSVTYTKPQIVLGDIGTNYASPSWTYGSIRQSSGHLRLGSYSPSGLGTEGDEFDISSGAVTINGTTNFGGPIQPSSGLGIQVHGTNPGFFITDGTYSAEIGVNSAANGWVTGTAVGDLVIRAVDNSIDFVTSGGLAMHIDQNPGVGFDNRVLFTGGDNTYDIGLSGSFRPRSVYVGTSVVIGGNAALTNGGAGGTPSSLTLTNATGLPITGITSSTSAQLRTLLSDENGTGAALFDGATSPTFVTPILGTPTSGTVTNLTGTASININGTVGATTPTTGAFTTLSNTGAATNSVAGAASTPALKISGVPFAGTGTTSFPLLYLNDANATASTTLSTSGTSLGVNAHTGIGNLVDLMLDGASKFSITSTGVTTIAGNLTVNGSGNVTNTNNGFTAHQDGAFAISSRGRLATGGSSGVLYLDNGTAGRWASLNLGNYDAGTTTVTNGLIVGHRSSGTAAAGLGSAVLFNIDSSTTADQNAVQLSGLWTTATHASRTADFVVKNVNNAAALAETFRVTAAGNVSQVGKTTTYNNIATVSGGIPSEVATIDSTGLTANVGASTLYAVPASGAGLYRVSAYLVTTTAASVSSTMPNAQVVYTDSDSNTSVTLDVSPILGAAGLGQSGLLTANAVGTVFSGTVVVYIKASTTIQYQTVNYASTAGGMTYALRMKLEAL